MSNITATDVKNLRERTGAGMQACKTALVECGGDFEKAVDYLRKKGLAAASKKEGRIAAEGTIATYVHGGRIGVMVEVNCETDFVAKNSDFQTFANDVALHICASDPKFLRAEEMDADFIKRESEIYTDQLKAEGKPEKMIPKILEGKMSKLSSEVCLLEKKFIKNTDITIQDLINELTLKLGEKIAIRRFSKFKLGEGIEKKADNLADEVAKIASGSAT